MLTINELRCEYSDLYKEVNGHRPRHMAGMCEAELSKAIRRLYERREALADLPTPEEAIVVLVPLAGAGWSVALDASARERLLADMGVDLSEEIAFWR